MLNKSQRLLLGLFVLLLVDIIWVTSSELTKYVYKSANFEKPFFITYIKTSMFTIYLLGLYFWPPWREQCSRPANYVYINSEVEEEGFFTEENTRLSDPTYVPIKLPERNDRSSGTESDDCSVNRGVRFSKLAEVRQMSETDAKEALLARLSYAASLRASEMYRRTAIKMDIEQVCKIASMFCMLWFTASYSYQAAMMCAEPAMVTVLSSSSGLFTLFLSALFPSNAGDKFTVSKLVAVCVTIFGLVLVSLSDIHIGNHAPLGIVLSFTAAFFYATYLVFLRRQVDHEDKMDIPLFFGFVGFFNMILIWPVFFLLHFSHLERFEWPTNHQWLSLLLNGLLGTVLSEVLWLWGCFLTSSLIATVALSLTIPLSMMVDVLFERVHYPSLFYAGTLPVFVSFLAVTLLAHYDNYDPVLEAGRSIYTFFFRKTKSIRINECEIEQTQSLIGINDGDHEA